MRLFAACCRSFLIIGLFTGFLMILGCSEASSPVDGDSQPDGDTLEDGDADSDPPTDGDQDPEADDDADTLPEDPNRHSLGGFDIRFDPQSQGLSILSWDGRVLLEPPAPASPAGADDPPVAQFATRRIELGYKMLYGSFKPDDTPKGPWIPAETVSWVRGENSVTLALRDGENKNLAAVIISSPDVGQLVIRSESDDPNTRLSIGFACTPDDHFMGFGSQSFDVDHRGQTVACWVQEQGVGKVEDDNYTDPDWMLIGRRHAAHMPIPQYVARRGYAAVVDGVSRPVFALCSESEDRARIEVSVGDDLHIFDGPTPAEALEKSSFVFGRPRIPPAFAFAPWLDAIHGKDAVMGVAQKLRDEGVPSSVIWTEDWKGASQDGDNYVLTEEWSLDRVLYPDFEQMVSDLHDMGFKSFIYFNTFIFNHASIFEEVTQAGLTVKNADGEPYLFAGHKMPHKASVIDFSNPDAKTWVQDRLNDALDLGVDGWMGDFAEWLPSDSVTHQETGWLQHNRHPLQWQQTQREVLDAHIERDGRERLFFSRSGWLGTPEYADVFWAGDQSTTFNRDDGIKTILPIGIGLGVVGVSTYGHDIAGYQARFNDPTDRELFFRWTELGAWSPVMRTHHGYQASLNWQWDNDELTIDHFRRYAKLHIALAPYWRGLATVAHNNGLSIWRGLGLMFPDDESVWPITDQVMVGDGVMVAPILDRADTPEASFTRNVYLPAGRWYVWDGGHTWEGPTTISVEAEMSEIPVFARAGTIVPMYPDGVMTLSDEPGNTAGPESVGDDRIIKVFLGASGRFEEAGGLSYELEQLAPATTELDAALGDSLGSMPTCEDIPSIQWNCAKTESKGVFIVRVTGSQTVTLKNSGGEFIAVLKAENGDDARKLEWHVNH
jgi:alpha-glucosidase (family GH31 glycosyl hydrolase)